MGRVTVQWGKLSIQEARDLQEQLARQLVLERLKEWPSTIAGLDIAYIQGSKLAVGAVVVFRLPGLVPVAWATNSQEIDFPYIPGLLSFREGPLLLATLDKLDLQPEVLIFDGQGIAHPKGLGLASHMGVVLDRITIGCAKRVLIGHHGPVGNEPGAYSYLRHNDRIIGAALRTRRDAKPVYVSPGHRIDLASAIELVMGSCRGYRLPEPIRQAHLLANETRKQICSGCYTP